MDGWMDGWMDETDHADGLLSRHDRGCKDETSLLPG